MKVSLLTLLIIAITGCNHKDEETPAISYSILYSHDTTSSLVVFDNNDTIYVADFNIYTNGKNSSDFEDCIKIKSDKPTIDRIITSVKTHLNSKSLLLERSTLTCGAGGTLYVKSSFENGKKELVLRDLATKKVSANLAVMLSELEDKYIEIHKIFNRRP